MLDSVTWTPRSAWAGLCERGGRIGRETAHPGVIATPLQSQGLATIICFEGKAEPLAATMRSAHGIECPSRTVAACGAQLNLLWSGPSQWLAVSDKRDIAATLQQSLSGLAAVSDQSDARASLHLSGPKVRETLAKGWPVDLHPLAFLPGAVALTQIGHIGVQLWRLDSEDAFMVLLARSMAGSFWAWLTASGAEFGMQADPAGTRP